MAKDPAFLFYSNDFLTGTYLLSFDDRGKYITLLCLMHQQGRLSEQSIISSLGSISENLKAKFKIDENGFWYNERLEEEIDKRKRHSAKQKINIQNRWNTKTIPNEYQTDTKLIPLENENENVNENSIVLELKNKKPIEECIELASADSEWVKNSEFSGKVKDEFITHLKGSGEVEKSLADFKKHFWNWKKKLPEEKKPLKLVFK